MLQYHHTHLHKNRNTESPTQITPRYTEDNGKSKAAHVLAADDPAHRTNDQKMHDVAGAETK